MKRLYYAVAGAWLALVLACGGGAAEQPTRTVPGEPYAGADEDLTHRCAQAIDARCTPPGGAIDAACINEIADGYRELGTHAQRQSYLIERGCAREIAMDDRGPVLGDGSTSGGSVHVRGYTRRDGTHVRAHTRSRPR